MIHRKKKLHFLGGAFLAIAALLSVVPAHCFAATKEISNLNVPKYIFLFIGDGMSFPQITALGTYNGTVKKNFVGTLKKPTPDNLPEMDMPSFVDFPVNAAVLTPDASKFITDSASAATAMASGIKTLDGMLGVDPHNKKFASIATLLRDKLDYKVGIISTMSLDHATPAAFYAHNASRSDYYGISMDLIASGFDFFGGGGIVLPTGKNKDKPDFFELAKKAGYNIVNTESDIRTLNAKAGKTIAINPLLDKSKCMKFSIDTKDPKEVRLREFVSKGIELIDNSKGFFMMVEAGKIDFAGHANDAFTAIMDLRELDESVKVAVDFAKKHPNETLIVVVGDHETGGLTVGFGGLNYDTYMKRLGKQEISYQTFALDYIARYRENKIPFETAMKDVQSIFGLIMPDTPEAKTAADPGLVLSPREVTMLQNGYAESLLPRSERNYKSYDYYANYTMYTFEPFGMVVTQILNNKAGLGWTTGSHTALPVSLHAMGASSELFRGFYDNTEIFKKIKLATKIQ